MLIRVLLLFICFLLQIGVRNNVLLFGFAPDFLIMGFVLTVKKNDILDGVILGAGCGLLYDLIAYSYFGFGIFTLTLAGFLTAVFKKHVFTDNIISKMLIALLVSLINGIITLLIINSFYVQVGITIELVRVVLPVAVYTAVILSVPLFIYYLFSGKLKKVFG
ncbi:MAG: rod shape-determining protein MreD [Candidatus Firestonebacteria bacterium RIFOXYA2_FULL_40_8]|nr:MAG: rod shape-determining protein MreD [Candidatus Firestonebacteria bacterium RIFOXYA2_FULL_40_8]